MLIYLHLPKTAGTTMMQVLKKNYLYHEFYRIQNEGSKILWINMSKEEKKVIKCLTGHIAYGLHEYVLWECQYATFLRHPFERIISWYYYIRGKKHDLAKMCTDMTLTEVIESQEVSETNNGMTRYLAGRRDIGIYKPYNITTKEDLDLAKIRLETFAFIGFTDTFDESLAGFAETFGWTDLDYVPMLVNNDKPTVDDLSPAEIEVLTKYNEQDLELYSFAKEIA